MKIYAIPNCNTVKKARAWLQDQGLIYEFHDYKKQGVPTEVLQAAMRQLGWQTLLNRAGPTWRKLPEEVKAGVTDAPSALAVMQAHSSVIRRPLLEWNGWFEAGFSEARYVELFKK
ncbi:MAG TPA: arsenate reductase [Thiobacillaceae bacterium]|nr:arsenate reductase [Thiobacillaceae bacterium]HNU63058.1 arsenate reductase [Thiobacillaceae bacterium]